MTDANKRCGESILVYDVSPDESLSEGVVEAVTTVSGDEPTPFTEPRSENSGTLEPLYSAVDPDALDAIFRTGGVQGCITFSYHGYEVTAHSEGRVAVEPLKATCEAAD